MQRPVPPPDPTPEPLSPGAGPQADRSWDGRTIVVTGARRGIGATLSRMWLARGATVLAHCRDESAPGSRVAHLADGLPGAAERLHGFGADAAVAGRMGAAFRRLLDERPEVDAILFNHGTTTFAADGETILVGPPSSFDANQMRTLLQVNALSVWEALHEVGRRWARDEVREENARRRRAIVLESSSGALNPHVFDPVPYKISKAMLGEPRELFEVMDLFLSGRAAFSTGNNLTLNGGAYVISQ